ncbi:MAG: DNA-binding protein, partial [Anaerolineae bacterium]|nr:DNA-binding protein [Anaerolineae bacterium]
TPGQDLRREIMQYADTHHIRAGFVITCVGSLTRAVLRLANDKDTTLFEDHYEIIALVGTVEVGGAHLHLSISDPAGAMIGGHLKDGSLVRTTAEVILGAAPNLVFRRKFDSATGYAELIVDEL